MSRSWRWPPTWSSATCPIENPDDIPVIAEALATKRVCIEIVPEKVVSWDHSKLAGRY